MATAKNTGAPARSQQSPEAAAPQSSAPAQPPESPPLPFAVADGFYEDLARFLTQARAIIDLIGSVDPEDTEGITVERASWAAKDLIDRAKDRADEWLNASRGVKFSGAEANHG